MNPLTVQQGALVPHSGWITTAFRATGQLFYSRDRAGDEPRWCRWLLLVILVAGTLLRFWGLGDIGLHREDEDTSALPVLHILDHGTPLFPSGMFYGRAIVHSYLMAGSVALFGNSEWALRLPSALCGVLLIGFAYLAGRRFLAPHWNVVFAAVTAFLPSLVLASQTARMYIFLLTCLAGFAALIFRWERTGRLSDLMWAVVVMVLAVQFHSLAVFSAFLVFFPALLHGDQRRFWQASAAFVVIAVVYFHLTEWIGSYYPQPASGYSVGVAYTGPAAGGQTPPMSISITVIASLGGVLLAWLVARRLPPRLPAVSVFALLALGMVCQVLLHYHIALLLMMGAAVVAMRSARPVWPSLLFALLGSVLLTVVQVMRIHDAGVHSVANIAGIMLGRPSVWPYIRMADYSVVALLTCAVGVLAGLWRMARRQRLPDFWLLFVLWGWIPLLLVGTFVWYPPPRYTIITLLPMVLVGIASIQWLSERALLQSGHGSRFTAAAVAAILIVNPLALAGTLRAGYGIHPDHVGAAHFVRDRHPGPRDILVAEDVIVQAYYLGKVDYWLLSHEAAADFVERVNGEVRDIYTHARIIGSGEELQALIDRPDRGTIYIIGSGENQSDGRRYMRGESIHRLLTVGGLPLAWTGRDGLTKVWVVPPPPPPTATPTATQEH